MENPHEITLVALGPLTNLAHALMQEPQIAYHVKEVVIFAGDIKTPGNCSPFAEANVWGDPHAADKEQPFLINHETLVFYRGTHAL